MKIVKLVNMILDLKTKHTNIFGISSEKFNVIKTNI